MAKYACLHCLEDIEEDEPYHAIDCIHCLEDIDDDEPCHVIDDGASRVHLDCMIRLVVGSVGHQMKKCTCYGGNQDDPPGMTTRQAASAAAALFRHRG